MKKNIFSLLASLLILSVVLAGCGGSEEVSESKPTKDKVDKVSVALLKLAGGAPLFIASEKGFFEEENIEVEYEWFDASNPVNVAVASNKVDVGAAGLTADLYNMVAAGQKVSIIADKGKEVKGYPPVTAVMIHKDSPIQSIEDLKGKKVGVTTIGSAGHYSIGKILENHNMSLKDIELVPMNTTAALMEALKGEQLDSVLLNSSNIKIVENEGYGKMLVSVADEMNYQSTALFASPEFIKNKDVVVRFLRAYAKGTQYYHDAILTKEGDKLVKGENYDEVVQITAKYTGNPEEIITNSFPYIEADGTLTVDDIETQIKWYTKEKLLNKELNVDDIVNTEFLDEALKEEGK